ncbi:flagellar hook protein FlgE [Campylobacter mucosalis]|uniref:flagellar hook protein FlgE n=1 Tax=Campylobacter mucosalis TaxID=202 RepID=UPI0004D728B1|nr:flagellar hook protein FlgE [Campylobacter mucosalis]KEA45401.1 flagellar hook protein FlgE [Campylobacter mucosalis]QKF63821.1 flagellar hook protein, epsilonproteobacterial variant [Campylobacter mucosalis]
MMRSLWSGVTGLQAHQIAMDVEGNNISNVNTVGFKYSRANFADIISQTPTVATAPQGERGGMNATQIGLGTSINSTTRIFSQGTLQSTDKNTDVALQGNGFFVVSPDGGRTRYYTRNGDFLFDKAGNFVNNGGFIVQGWTRDDETGAIDATGPIRNIVIKEGLTTPARATSVVNVKANLDSGDSIGTRSTPVYSLDEFGGGRDKNNDDMITELEVHAENDRNSNEFFTNSKNEQVLTERGVDLAVLYNETGNALRLRNGQGIWVSYANAKTEKFTIGSAATNTIGQVNAGTLDITLNGVNIKSPNGAITSISDVASLINAQTKLTGVSAEISEGNKLTLINRNNTGTTQSTKNIHLIVNNGNQLNGVDQTQTSIKAVDVITAYQYVYSSTATTPVHTNDDKIARVVNTTEDLRAAMQEDARDHVDYNGDGKIEADSKSANAATIAQNVFNKMGQQPNLDQVKNILEAFGKSVNPADVNAYKKVYEDAANQAQPPANTDAEKHKAGIQALIAKAGADTNDQVKFTINKEGQFQLTNPKNGRQDHSLYMSITGLTSEAIGNVQAVNENVKLTTLMRSLEGSLSPSEAVRNSGAMVMSSHGSTIEIFDSLGSKHTVSIKWAKTGTTPDGGTEWGMIIQVPEPAEINFSGEGPANVITGSLRFNSDGSLGSFYPAGFTFTANNGSQSGQSVRLNFGLGTDFNGLTSNDRDSSTDYVSQDGYEGGALKDVRIDQSGTVIGAFTNGQSFGLAQVALATFTNEEGLTAEGGNLFLASANSGEAVIGAAGTGNKGTIASAKLEQSNVDLSRALTQLIIVQRGFQANSKTITTSDEMLNTLLQLKN